jgi:CHASE3 domain sensor protein
MDKELLKQTIQRLHQQLEQEHKVDPEVRELLTVLDTDIHVLFAEEDASQPLQTEGLVEKAEALAARFAADHPRAEAMMRELVAALAKMGV